jgi:MFS transporter, PPP family, 3-phenylpropionic acid transporter
MRWALMAFDPPLWATIVLKCLHAMSLGAGHLAAMYFLSQPVPHRRGVTAQGIYTAVVAGLVLGMVTIACGPLYGSFASKAYSHGFVALVGATNTVFLGAALAW